jgi:hypothetical protein
MGLASNPISQTLYTLPSDFAIRIWVTELLGLLQSSQIGRPSQPKPTPKSVRQIASCMVPQLIDNFIGQGEGTTDRAPMTVVVNIGLYLVIRTAARSPALVPGYGWLYAGAAVAYDAALVAKSYAACRQ